MDMPVFLTPEFLHMSYPLHEMSWVGYRSPRRFKVLPCTPLESGVTGFSTTVLSPPDYVY